MNIQRQVSIWPTGFCSFDISIMCKIISKAKNGLQCNKVGHQSVQKEKQQQQRAAFLTKS